MRELRIGIGLAALSAMAAWGCDGGGSTMNGTDSGMLRPDTGTGVVDSGPPRDSGSPPDTGMQPVDSGGGTMSCGPTGGECDISNPSSCGVGNACHLSGSSEAGFTTYCAPAGTGTNGASCSSSAQCAEGFVCDDSKCRRYCCSTADCNPPEMTTGQICNQLLGANEAGICTEADSCTLPLPQTGCGDGEACNVFMAGLTICDPAGTGTEGTECAARNACIAGFICVGEPGRCRQYCDQTASTPCPDGFVCAGLGGAPANIGVCVPMS